MSLGLDHGEELNEVHELGFTLLASGGQAAAGQASPGELPQRGGGEAGASDRDIIDAEEPAPLRRWAISVVVVLLVHGAIATAVITWRKTTVAPAEPPRSIVIELVPAPGAPATQQTELAPAPEQKPAKASPDKPIEKVEENTEEKAAVKGEKVEPKPVEEPPRVAAPVTSTPPERAEGERGADTRAATGGGAAQAPGIGTNPIDTRIAEPPRLRFKKAAKANDWKNTIMGRPSNMARPLKNFAGQQLRDPGAAGSMTRNAVGALVQNPAAAAGPWGPSATDGMKNAV